MSRIPGPSEINSYFYHNDIEGLVGGMVEGLALNLPHDPVKYLQEYLHELQHRVEEHQSYHHPGRRSQEMRRMNQPREQRRRQQKTGRQGSRHSSTSGPNHAGGHSHQHTHHQHFHSNQEMDMDFSFPPKDNQQKKPTRVRASSTASMQGPKRGFTSIRHQGSIGNMQRQGSDAEISHTFSYINDQSHQSVQVEHDPTYVDKGRTVSDIDSNEAEAIRRRYSVSHDRRSGFSAEIIQLQELQQKPPVHPKTDDEKARLATATANNIMIKSLDKDGRDVFFSAMFETNFEAGATILKQGDEGDNFYVVESGECEILKKEKDDEDDKLVQVVKAGGTFGELALIHGTPRAATVRAKTSVKCWAIDRMTYRKIMMNATLNKRKTYEEFLKNVTVLENLTSYERMTVADALVQCDYEDGDLIIKQGEQGHSFYIVVSGEVVVTKKIKGKETEVARLSAGNYFGELALLLDQPRAATVRAVGSVSLVRMGRRSFNILLGPCISIMKRDLKKYNSYIAGKII